MPYLNEAGLFRYDPKLKEWIASQPVKTIPPSLYPWTLTDKAGAVTCWPVGGTELKPTVDFMFSETGPASGTKGPENPSTIVGVSEVSVLRTNKNLCSTPFFTNAPLQRDGILWTVNADGSITANGEATANSYFYAIGRVAWGINGVPIACIPDTKYFLSGCPTGGSSSTYYIYLTSGSGSTYSNALDTGSGAVFIPKDGAGRTVVVQCTVTSGIVANNLVFRPQLEAGESATSFEVVPREKYTIPLNGTYYGGEIDLATGVMTVTKEFVSLNTINVSDGISGGNAIFRAWPESLGILKPTNDGTEVCEELPRATNGTGINRFFVGAPVNGNCPIYVILNPSLLDLSGAADPSNPTATEVRAAGIAYLNAHPLHMVLSLEAPYTVQLTPAQISALAQTDKYTPRLNTLYTDASSVQVGYVKSPIREEYELQQAIVSQGGNI